MTTFFNPTEAPVVHIEQLPSNAIAVEAACGDYTSSMTTAYALYISVWAPRSTPMKCRSGSSDEEFVDSTCYECTYHTDTMEFEPYHLDYPYLQTPEGELAVVGTVSFASPCPCYENGIGEVEFPCHAGHDGPEVQDTDDEIDCSYMSYGVIRSMDGTLITDWAQQQGVQFRDSDGACFATEAYPAVNTFNNSTPRNICWGSNDSGNSLLEIEMLYTTSYANEDLLSFSSHNENADDVHCEMDNGYEDLAEYPYVIKLSEYNHRPKGLAAASARGHVNAYMLMTASGCKLSTGVAFTPVELYRNVAVDQDTILDVWVSDVMPTGCRLMYLMYPNPDEGSIFLGQIPADFNLQPCESNKQQSSGAGELVNS